MLLVVVSCVYPTNYLALCSKHWQLEDLLEALPGCRVCPGDHFFKVPAVTEGLSTRPQGSTQGWSPRGLGRGAPLQDCQRSPSPIPGIRCPPVGMAALPSAESYPRSPAPRSPPRSPTSAPPGTPTSTRSGSELQSGSLSVFAGSQSASASSGVPGSPDDEESSVGSHLSPQRHVDHGLYLGEVTVPRGS